MIFSKTPETAFSQNIVKTSIASVFVFLPVVAFLAVFRSVSKNSSVKLSLYQIGFLILFILFMLDLAFVSDRVLNHFGYDIDKLYTNIGVFVLFFIFWLVQHAFFAVPFVKNLKLRTAVV
ncbi:hypothetical protein [Acinetobacter sp. P1(2025)]|uniref:hypothetical protein n=1 Tax=Acinetobacter sp. P1(2025) TaxID=3446120 RepID=UPI003F52C9C4